MARKLVLALVLAAVLAGAALAGSPRQAHTPADVAKAKAALLRLSDFPTDWTARPSAARGGSATCPSFAPDESDLTETGSAISPSFVAPGLSQVLSVVSILKTQTQAQADWSRVVKPAMLGCFAEQIGKSAPAGSTVVVLSKGTLVFPKLAPRAASYRLVAGVTPKGTTAVIKLYLDLVLLGKGRDEALTTMLGVGQPLDPAFERKLASATVARLR